MRPTGYSIDIVSVFEVDGTLLAVVVEASPAPGCINMQVTTAPVVTVRMEADPGEVMFVEEMKTVGC